MHRIAVTSRNLASVGYEREHRVLEIEFRNGRVYEYFEVPEGVYGGIDGNQSRRAPTSLIT
jgi:KTSC domain